MDLLISKNRISKQYVHLMKLCIYCVVIFGISITNLFSQSWSSTKVVPDGNGCFTYPADSEQNRIPNFSHAGYKGGGVELPNVPVVATISPISGDNTAHIQFYIDSIGALPLNSDGFRGALFLNPGVYEIHGQLFIPYSGVVLRGSGDGRTNTGTTTLYGKGNTPHQRDLIKLGSGSNTDWEDELPNTRQDIITSFVQVGSYSFEVADASSYAIGDNIIVVHPSTEDWLNAVNYGDTDTDDDWTVGSTDIVFHRYITAISGNEITLDAPVYNHLDLSLAQSYIYKHDRINIRTNIGFENIKVEIEHDAPDDENHAWNAVALYGIEDAWVINSTMQDFGFSGVITETAYHVSVINVRSVDPVSIVQGGNMYNFNTSDASNNILFDNCYARAGRHHYISNGKSSVSGVVVLNSESENPFTTSEGHRRWSTGMLFDNLIDYGTFPGTSNKTTLAFYNRGSAGTSHGWAAAHSVFWNCSTERPGLDAAIVVQKPPTAQNYAIGCNGTVNGNGNFDHPTGFIEGTNSASPIFPSSLYEAQLLCRADAVLADFIASKTQIGVNENITFTDQSQGSILTYEWDFGEDSLPASATGIGPHEVRYITKGSKNVSLTVSNSAYSHNELKSFHIEVSDQQLHAVDDQSFTLPFQETTIGILQNDSYPPNTTNYALEFDGIDDRVVYEPGDEIIDAYPLAYSLWVKTTSTQDDVLFYIGQNSSNIIGHTIEIRDDKAYLEAGARPGNITDREHIDGMSVINDDEWHHIVGIFTSADEMHLYVDGILEGANTNHLDIFDNHFIRKLSVGNRDDASPNAFFKGQIDDVRVITDFIASADVIDLMNGALCSEKEEYLFYSFDQINNNIVSDEVNHFDAQLTGALQEERSDNFFNVEINITLPPINGNAVITNNEIVYTPDLGFTGTDALTYELKSGPCELSTAEVSIIVKDLPSQTSAYIEAESGIIGNDWSIQSDSMACGLEYLSPPNVSSSNNPSFTPDEYVSFVLSIETGGAYNIFARTATTGISNDALWVRTNEGVWINWNTINGPNYPSGYHWEQVGEWDGSSTTANPVTFNLMSGVNTIDIAWGEHGVRLDKILVTQSDISVINEVQDNSIYGNFSFTHTINNACPHDTVIFDTTTDNTPFQLTNNTIEIGIPLTVIGNNPSRTIIDGMGLRQAILNATNNTLSLQNIKFANHFALLNGGALFNNGTLHLKGVTFENNHEGTNPKAFTNNGIIYINEDGIVSILE